MDSYEQRKQRLIAEMQAAKSGEEVALAKDTSNLFRERKGAVRRKLNVRDFHHVLQVNAAEGWVEVEGMTTYADLVDALLPHGCMPAVVPQLKSITIGGAVSGVGIEATSFRHGLVHETVLEMEVLLPGGRVVLCTPENEHKDLFFGIPNSYGTLGYILKLKARVIPVKPYVRVEHRRFADASAYFRALEEACAGSSDFVDGVVFSATEMILSVASFTDTAPAVSDYTYRRIYYRSLREKTEDFLTAKDYIWRWDTDWFWVSKNLGFQNPFLRLMAGRRYLNSVTYTKIMRWNSRWRFTDRLGKLLGRGGEGVIQDIFIPVSKTTDFLSFLLREIRITPIWICPTRSPQGRQFPIFPLDQSALYVDFGFWDIVPTPRDHPRGFYNRKVEAETGRLGGLKSLYSEAFYPPEEFWRIYSKPVYDRLKAAYDPQGNLRDLYAKTVLRA